MSYVGLLDCNNFFVSCERLFRPDLWNKPVGVLSSNDGVIVARSNELKTMGVPMGIPLFKAKKLVDFDGVTLFSSNFTLYRDISSRVMEVLEEEVGKCEVYSIDEAFFNIGKNITTGDLVNIRERIIKKIGIPVSIGVAGTKTLAKAGSEFGKRGEGICLLTTEKWLELAKTYPCSEVWNLGRATTVKLKEIGVQTAEQFMLLDESTVQSKFGVSGRRIQDELKGLKVYNVGEENHDLQQSMTSSRSFSVSTSKFLELQSALSYHVSHAAEKLRQKKLVASKMYISVQPSRHSDFVLQGATKEVLLGEPTASTEVLTKAAIEALNKIFKPEVPYKKAGVILSGLAPNNLHQVSLFTKEKINESQHILDSVKDVINNKFGFGTLRSAVILDSGARSSVKLRSNEYTTKWKDIPRVYAK